MNNHVSEWIPAYYDGELHGARQQRIEEHLNQCPACQAELEQLRALSRLLQAAAAPQAATPAGQFAAQVNLRLPRIPASSGWQRALKAGWQAAPLGLIFTWAFGQAILIMAGLVTLSGLADFFSTGSRLSLPFTNLVLITVVPELVELLGSVFPWLRVVEPLLQFAWINIGFTGVLGVFLWGWIASWWVYKTQRLPA